MSFGPLPHSAYRRSGAAPADDQSLPFQCKKRLLVPLPAPRSHTSSGALPHTVDPDVSSLLGEAVQDEPSQCWTGAVGSASQMSVAPLPHMLVGSLAVESV